MTRYLLDTTTLIDDSKDLPPTRAHILNALRAGDELGVCAVIVAEFESGLLAAGRPRWERFLSRSLRYWIVSLAGAQRAGQERFAFARRGIQLSAADALIAAVAREVGAVLVTDNVKDFPQADLQVVSWRS